MKIYIIHGYTASSDEHWYPWLENALLDIGIQCERLTMPNSHNPIPEEWLAHLEQHIKIDEKTVLVGHSLGCIAILNFLAQKQQYPAGIILVSGFYQPLHTIPELTVFTDYYATLSPPTDINSIVISALDDQIVPHSYSDALAQHLNANYIRLKKGGHFLDREGWEEFPLVLETIKKLFNIV